MVLHIKLLSPIVTRFLCIRKVLILGILGLKAEK